MTGLRFISGRLAFICSGAAVQQKRRAENNAVSNFFISVPFLFSYLPDIID